MPERIDKIANGSFPHLDQKWDRGVLDSKDGTIDPRHLANADSDNSGTVTLEELRAALTRLAERGKDRRLIKKLERRLARLEKAVMKFAETTPPNRMEVGIAYAIGGLSQGLAAEIVNDIRASVYETRRERVETRRDRLVKTWDKALSRTPPSPTSASAALAPKVDPDKRG